MRELALAAAALPLCVPSAAQAEPNAGVDLQYGRYQESARNLYGVESAFAPIQVDYLHSSLAGMLTDRISFELGYTQDTWSGATPIASAPRPLGGNRPTDPDGVSGATPYLEGELYLTSDFEVLETDGFGNPTDQVDDQVVHTISSASPETRRRFDASLGWFGDRMDFVVGGGVSYEPDYISGFVDVGGRFEFDRQNTVLEVDLAYTHGRVRATLDHDAVPYIDTSAYDDVIEIDDVGNRTIDDTRFDFSARLGLVQVAGRRTRVETSLRYRHSQGYLENPYKVVEVAFIDPHQQFLAPPGGYFANVHALIEERPHRRNEVGVAARGAYDLALTRTAIQAGYDFRADDWGIRAHVFDLRLGQSLGFGFTLMPSVRYASQSPADFYVDYLVSEQAFRTIEVDGGGNFIGITPFDPALLPDAFSSDFRLMGFGVVSSGFSLQKSLGEAVRLAFDFEYAVRRSRFQLGGGDGRDFADFNAYWAGGAIEVDLNALARARLRDSAHRGHAWSAGPAGLRAAHMMEETGAVMLGYRYSLGIASGDIRRGFDLVSDDEIVSNACQPSPCAKAPDSMAMHMHMLELMVAPTHWLNIAVMGQYVDKYMEMRQLDDGLIDDHTQHQSHGTGGWGDLQILALAKLFASSSNRLHAGLGLSVPTGSVDETHRRSHQESRGYLQYGMQLGSGTFDFLPSLTWRGRRSAWSWGAQVGGVVRMQHENRSGYALGDRFDASVWGGYAIWPWLETSLRGVVALQGEVRGEYDGSHPLTTPPDHPTNYGGWLADLGIGVRAEVSFGPFEGQSVGLEWLQPLATDFNGYQLERVGTLVVDWRLHF